MLRWGGEEDAVDARWVGSSVKDSAEEGLELTEPCEDEALVREEVLLRSQKNIAVGH